MDDINGVRRSKVQAEISYDKLSKWYDFIAGGSEKKFRDQGLAKLDVRQGETVLEVGFGTGYCLDRLARAVGKDGKVCGLDISAGMLGKTAARLGKSGLLARVELQRGDAAALPYRDGIFDAIFCSFTLELFDTPDIPIVLGEFRRVLKDSGRICVVSMSREGKPGIMTKIYDWGHKAFPNTIDCRPIHVRQAMASARFTAAEASVESLLGLPIEIVLARR